jgi:hypothetical protein
MEISGFFRWIKPPGFQEAAVASSVIEINAPPIPNALAPDPTGLGVEVILISGGITVSSSARLTERPAPVKNNKIER